MRDTQRGRGEHDQREGFHAHNVLQMKRIVIPATLILIGLPLAASAFKEGPYPNVTGGFGEQTCHLCHLDNPVNAPGGSVQLDGIPPVFTAGKTYPITVTISRD